MFKPVLLLLCLAAPAIARPWSDDVMYFMMTDRFHDGDPENNSPAGCDPALFDPHQKDISRYMGGDLRGVEKAIQSGYFNDLGVTALWLTPVVKKRFGAPAMISAVGRPDIMGIGRRTGWTSIPISAAAFL